MGLSLDGLVESGEEVVRLGETGSYALRRTF